MNICVWTIALSPMLDVYVFSFLPNIPIQFFIYFILFVALFIKTKNKNESINKKHRGSLLVTFVLLFISFLDVIMFGVGVNVLADLGKLLTWGLSIYLFSLFLDADKLRRAIIGVAIFNAGVVLVQSFFFYIFSIRLPNVMDLGLITYRVNDMSQFLNAYRPAAFSLSRLPFLYMPSLRYR